MGVIQKQSIQSTIVIMFGFAIGAFNMILFAPKVLTAEEMGLTRIIIDAGVTLATLCTLGSIPVIYKFFPFYRSYLKKEQNDLPFVTLMICLVGFVLMCVIGFLGQDIIVQKFSERSPLFVEYSYLVYPYGVFMLLFVWLESFSWSFRKGVVSNSLKETIARVIFTVLLLAFSINLINLHQFLIYFSCSYAIPVIILFSVLRKTGEFSFIPKVSSVTTRLRAKMTNFGLFIFAGQFLNLLSRTVDTFILSAKSARGLSDAAVFTIATYVITLMEVPQRSINSITIPILAESWKNKDIRNISNIYIKSVANLLVIGLSMFGLIWLNVHNLSSFLGKDYSGIEFIVLFMGVGKLIDLGTGANSQIIGTSSYWKVDFTTNVIYTLVALPLNYFLIARYGLMGAAYSSLIALTFYNIMRFGFLWFKFGLQPYTSKDLLAVILAVICIAIIYFLPQQNSVVLDTILRSIGYLILFLPMVYFLKISTEINKIMENLLHKALLLVKRKESKSDEPDTKDL